MPEFSQLRATDHGAAAEVAAVAYQNLESISLSPYLQTGEPRTQEAIGPHGLCAEASDAVTRAAHSLGILAARELHLGTHYVTTFGSLDDNPRGDDPIMCLTWGQFDLQAFEDHPQFFFGHRRDIRRHVSERDYAASFSPQSVKLRQVTHTPARFAVQGHVWLKTTPHDLMTTTYPVGLVEPGAYPYRAWENPGRLPLRLGATL